MNKKDYRKQTLIGFIVVLLLAITIVSIYYIAFTSANKEQPSSTGTSTRTEVAKPTVQKDIVQLTNEHRIAMGLGALAVNNTLNQSAEVKAADMCATNHFEHSLSNGSTWESALEGSGYTDYVKIGENLARGYNTQERAFKALLDSPTHRANIEDPEYTETGMFYNKCGGKNYIAIHYGVR